MNAAGFPGPQRPACYMFRKGGDGLCLGVTYQPYSPLGADHCAGQPGTLSFRNNIKVENYCPLPFSTANKATIAACFPSVTLHWKPTHLSPRTHNSKWSVVSAAALPHKIQNKAHLLAAHPLSPPLLSPSSPILSVRVESVLTWIMSGIYQLQGSVRPLRQAWKRTCCSAIAR